MIRFFDILFSLLGLGFGLPLFIIIYLIGLFDTGSPIFIQTRVGRNKKPFRLVKFRTMKIGTISTASHLANATSITRLGTFLRKTKIDELPQLFNVLRGEMSLVGPRPNLFSQQELIAERDALGIYDVLPGITGRAQIQNIDMSTPKLLAETDREMLESLTLSSYFHYIIITAIGRGNGDAVKLD